jgi:hypothetical protein
MKGPERPQNPVAPSRTPGPPSPSSPSFLLYFHPRLFSHAPAPARSQPRCDSISTPLLPTRSHAHFALCIVLVTPRSFNTLYPRPLSFSNPPSRRARSSPHATPRPSPISRPGIRAQPAPSRPCRSSCRHHTTISTSKHIRIRHVALQPPQPEEAARPDALQL